MTKMLSAVRHQEWMEKDIDEIAMGRVGRLVDGRHFFSDTLTVLGATINPFAITAIASN